MSALTYTAPLVCFVVPHDGPVVDDCSPHSEQTTTLLHCDVVGASKVIECSCCINVPQEDLPQHSQNSRTKEHQDKVNNYGVCIDTKASFGPYSIKNKGPRSIV